MINLLYRILLTGVFITLCIEDLHAQSSNTKPRVQYMARLDVYKGDTIPWIELRPVYIYKPLKFKSKRQQNSYNRLVRNVKKILPLAKEVRAIMLETCEVLETLPDKKSKEKLISDIEEEVKRTYTPIMKKLTFSQGKLLIKLIDRECNQSSYDILKAFMGSFKASFYQTFASLFGASLKKEYDPDNNEEDAMTERVIVLVENGQI